jgi:hypothetical protein
VLAQVEGVGQAGRGALEFERPARKSPAEAGLRFVFVGSRG